MYNSCHLAHLTLHFFLIVATIQIIIWTTVYSKLLFVRKVPKIESFPPATIVICTKNKLDNIKSNMPSMLSQSYDGLYIFLVDDFSDAEVAQYIMELQQKERYLLYHKVITNIRGKKQALIEAFVKTKTQWMLLTDDDCRPHSENWAKSMISAAFSTNSSIVLGYSPYRTNGSFLSRWIHYEAWITGVQYLSYAASGLPYMGVGRNILYDKKLVSPEHIVSHMDIISGDDDLTVNAIANRNNTTVNISEESFVWTDPPLSYSGYFNQKIRHYSVSHHYKMLHKVAISAYTLTQVTFYLLLICLMWTSYWKIAFGVYGIRLLFIMPLVKRLYDKMLSENSIWSFPIMDSLQAIYYVFFSFALFIPNKKKW
jgi:poly-beta-1,6-N-acetyl-D-glucosamine synthase